MIFVHNINNHSSHRVRPANHLFGLAIRHTCPRVYHISPAYAPTHLCDSPTNELGRNSHLPDHSHTTDLLVVEAFCSPRHHPATIQAKITSPRNSKTTYQQVLNLSSKDRLFLKSRNHKHIVPPSY